MEGPRSPRLQKLELEAYTAVLRALAATAMDWSKERLMTEIRRELHISTEEHFTVLSKVMEDEEITAIREGRPLPMHSGVAQPIMPDLSSRRLSQPPSFGGSQRTPGRPTKHPSGNFGGASTPTAAASERRGPGRPPNRGRMANGGAESVTPALRRRGKHRSTGSGMQVNELVGRSIWRHWPNEPQEWVKGIITDFKADTNEHTIVYDISAGNESWEDFDISRHRPGVDYELVEGEAADMRQPVAVSPAAPPLRTNSVSRKRKQPGTELPFAASTLNERLHSGTPSELESMRDALDAHARQLMAEIVALVAPVREHPDPVDRLQLQLQDIAARERTLSQQMSALKAAAG